MLCVARWWLCAAVAPRPGSHPSGAHPPTCCQVPTQHFVPSCDAMLVSDAHHLPGMGENNGNGPRMLRGSLRAERAAAAESTADMRRGGMALQRQEAIGVGRGDPTHVPNLVPGWRRELHAAFPFERPLVHLPRPPPWVGLQFGLSVLEAAVLAVGEAVELDAARGGTATEVVATARQRPWRSRAECQVLRDVTRTLGVATPDWQEVLRDGTEWSTILDVRYCVIVMHMCVLCSCARMFVCSCWCGCVRWIVKDKH